MLMMNFVPSGHLHTSAGIFGFLPCAQVFPVQYDISNTERTSGFVGGHLTALSQFIYTFANIHLETEMLCANCLIEN